MNQLDPVVWHAQKYNRYYEIRLDRGDKEDKEDKLSGFPGPANAFEKKQN